MLRKDWPLLALSFAGDGSLTPLQMQKIMFLMRMEAERALPDDFYNFIPYNYGPFDQSIYRDVRTLAAEGAVSIENDGLRTWPSYKITPLGREQAARVSMDENISSFLRRTVEWVKARSFAELLRAIYSKYPDYAVNSVFRDS